MRAKHDAPDLTIANGETDSDQYDESQLTGVRAIALQAPGTLPETITVQVSLDGGTNFAALQSPPGTDVTIAAGKAIVIDVGGFDAFRLQAGASVGADRVFSANFIEDIT